MDQKQVQELLKPFLAKIETLELSNQDLKERVRTLEGIIHNEPRYQKMTVSAANHLRDSRLSSRDSKIHQRPGWNSKTRVQHSPAKNSDPVSHEKIKTKPPIPKTFKSPAKHQDEPKPTSSQKKITGGTKFPEHSNPQNASKASAGKDNSDGSLKRENVDEKDVPVQTFSNKFEQLVKSNNEIITSMKQTIDKPKQVNPVLNQGNLVSKVLSPKSQYNNSPTTSPNSRSFISDNPDKDKQPVKT